MKKFALLFIKAFLVLTVCAQDNSDLFTSDDKSQLSDDYAREFKDIPNCFDDVIVRKYRCEISLEL